MVDKAGWSRVVSLTYMVVVVLGGLGSPSYGLPSRPVRTCSHGDTIHEGQSRSYELLEAKTDKSHHFLSAAFYWPKQVSRPAEDPEEG